MKLTLPITMPKFGLTMDMGQVSEWHVQPGQQFKAGDTIVSIETDKIVNDIEAPVDGMLLEISAEQGADAAIGEEIGKWELEGTEESLTALQLPAEEATAALGGVSEGMAEAAGDTPASTAEPRASAPAAKTGQSDTFDANVRDATSFERSLARRMQQVKQETPHFYLMTDVRADGIVKLKNELDSRPGSQKITYTHLLVAALAATLREAPDINRVWRDDGTVATFGSIDIGLAVDSEQGLVAPVVRSLGACTLTELAARVDRLIAAARSGNLRREDNGGAAFTISNGGMYDIRYMVPIINPGQSAILGIGSIRRAFRPDVNGKPLLTSELGITMSFDHRVFSGVEGIRIINRVKRELENTSNSSL